MEIKSITINKISPSLKGGMIFEVGITFDAWNKTFKVLGIREEEEFIRVKIKEDSDPDHKEERHGLLFTTNQIKKIDYYRG